MPQTSILKRTVKVLSAFICVHLRPIAEFGFMIGCMVGGLMNFGNRKTSSISPFDRVILST
jgi:hypothetical protein